MKNGDLDREQDTSERLLALWQSTGDPDALDRLLRVEIQELKRRVTSGARSRRMRVSDMTASGIAVDAAADVANARTGPRFQDLQSFRAYLWKAAQHLMLRHVRRRASRPEEPLGDGSRASEAAISESRVFGAVERADEAALLRFVLTFLEPDARDLVERAHLRDEKVDAIAASLGLTREAVEMRLVRARRALAKKLAAWKKLFE